MAYLVHGISPETDEYNKIIVRVSKYSCNPRGYVGVDVMLK